MFKLTKNEKNWILYDVGNSAFILLVSTILPIYFEHIAAKEEISSVTYLACWGYATSIATILVMLLGPFLGVKGDQKGRKRGMFFATVLIGAMCCSVMGLISSWILFLGIFILTKAFYSISLIYYDSMLTEVTTDERMDRVSSLGFAWGYIGSCIPFLLSLGLVLSYERIGISLENAFLIAFLITGIWWVLLSCPLFQSYHQKYYRKENKSVTTTFHELSHTLHEIIGNKKVLFFLLAFFFYIDGVYTVIDMSTIYGKALGLNSTGLLLALLVTQLIAFPCAIIFGRLSGRFDTGQLITVCILAYTAISVFAIFMDSEIEFWLLAVMVGIFQGGIQALSRSYYAKIVPKEKSSEYYGILDICGKGASFLGVTLVSIITQLSGSASKGVSVISLLMLLGLFLFRMALQADKVSSANVYESKV